MKRNGLYVKRTEFREALEAEFEQEITQDMVDDFIDFCEIDICEWLRDNVKHFEPEEKKCKR